MYTPLAQFHSNPSLPQVWGRIFCWSKGTPGNWCWYSALKLVFSVKFWISFVFNQYFCFYSKNSFLSRKLWKGVVYGQLAPLLNSTVPPFEPWILNKEFLLDRDHFNLGSHYSFLYHLGKNWVKDFRPLSFTHPPPHPSK